jgi:FkbM family methyltransferase
MRLGDQGWLNRLGKRITPSFGRAVQFIGATPFVDFAAAYLSLLVGKGAGTGWDRTEVTPVADRFVGIHQPIVIDCGANVGNWTIGLRELLSSDAGTWILVEPAPKCAAACRKIPNVEVIEAAAGEMHGHLQLHLDEGRSGLASLYSRRDTFAAGGDFVQHEVPVITIDDLIEQRALKTVHFLKMDIEGHELFALKGAQRSLENGTIRALTFEFGAGNINSRTYFRDFWDLLTPLGFRIERITPGGRTVKIVRYDEQLEFFRGVSNYIAVASD